MSEKIKGLTKRKTFEEKLEEYFNKKININPTKTPALDYVNNIWFYQVDKENLFNLTDSARKLHEAEKGLLDMKEEARSSGKALTEVKATQTAYKTKEAGTTMPRTRYRNTGAQASTDTNEMSVGTDTPHISNVLLAESDRARQSEAHLTQQIAEDQAMQEQERESRERSARRVRESLSRHPKDTAQRMMIENVNTEPARDRAIQDANLIEDENMPDDDKRKAEEEAEGASPKAKAKSKGKGKGKKRRSTTTDDIPTQALPSTEETGTARNRARSENPQEGNEERAEQAERNMETAFTEKQKKRMYEAQEKARNHGTEKQAHSETAWTKKNNGYLLDQIALRGFKTDDIETLIYQYLKNNGTYDKLIEIKEDDNKATIKRKKAGILKATEVLNKTNILNAIIKPNIGMFDGSQDAPRSRSARGSKD
jgi:hypothetical protein